MSHYMFGISSIASLLLLLLLFSSSTDVAAARATTTTTTSSTTCGGGGIWRHQETHHSSSNVMIAENGASLWVFSPSHRSQEDDPVNLIMRYRSAPQLPAWKYEFSCQSLPKLALSHTVGNIWALGCPAQQTQLYNGQTLTSKAGSVTLFQWNATRSKARIVQTIFGKNSTDQLGTSIAMSADGQTIALVASAGTAKEKRHDPTSSYLDVYQLQHQSQGRDKWQPLGTTIPSITKVAISSDGTILAGITTNKRIKIYRWEASMEGQEWQEEKFQSNHNNLRAESTSSMALSGNGQVLSLLQQVKGGKQALNIYRRIRQKQRNTYVWRLDSTITPPPPLAAQTSSTAKTKSATKTTFGWVASLSNNGKRIALAEPSFDRGAGAVHVYEQHVANNNSNKKKTWKQVGNSIHGTYPDSLGRHLHLSQNGQQLIIKALTYTAIYQYLPSEDEDNNNCKNNNNMKQNQQQQQKQNMMRDEL